MGRFYFLLSIKLGLGAKKDQTSQLAVRRLQVLELRDKCTGSVAGLVSLRGERVAKGIISQLISNAKYFAHARELSFFFFFFFLNGNNSPISTSSTCNRSEAPRCVSTPAYNKAITLWSGAALRDISMVFFTILWRESYICLLLLRNSTPSFYPAAWMDLSLYQQTWKNKNSWNGSRVLKHISWKSAI